MTCFGGMVMENEELMNLLESSCNEDMKTTDIACMKTHTTLLATMIWLWTPKMDMATQPFLKLNKTRWACL